MADDKPDPRNPPPLPPRKDEGSRPPLPPQLPKPGGAPPPLPAGGPPRPALPPKHAAGGLPKPPMPPMMGKPGLPPGGGPPAPPTAFTMPAPVPPAPPKAAVQDPSAVKEDYERKLGELEKRLMEEREKVLLANLKREEEAATSARVEVSLKELQDKLRRDRRESEAEESRLKLEAKIAEAESRLVQERETWVATLKNQMAARETEDKQIESHFGVRLQELERRWLEEKAQWQKLSMSKDEELRTLRTLAEKLRGVDGELQRVVGEKRTMEGRVAELTAERSENLVKVQTAQEREKEAIQLRADLSMSRREHAMLQERLDRELQSLRLSNKDREDRLMSDYERLQRDFGSLSGRLQGEHESELKRVKGELEADLQRQKETASQAVSEVQRLRGVCGALERQAAAARQQAAQLSRSQAEWERTQERFKAEFMVVQRKWAEREKEIKHEADEAARRAFETEFAALRLKVEREAGEREAQSVEKVRTSLEISRLEKEKAVAELKAQMEEAQAARRREAEEASVALSRQEQAFNGLKEERARLDAALKAAQEEVGALKAGGAQTKALIEADLAHAKEKLAREEKARAELAAEKSGVDRLAMAQAAEIKNLQDSFFALRGQLAKDAQMALTYMDEKERLEKKVAELEARLKFQGGSDGLK